MTGLEQNPSAFEETLAAALDGGGEAFEKLYRDYAGRVHAFAIARGVGDPEGLTNDVMLRLFQNLASFRGDETAFVRWLFTIARNRIIDLHRTASRRPQVVDAEVPEQPTASAESVAMDGLEVSTVAAYLELLTAEQREVIALRLVEDLSLNEVAAIVGRPVTAVKALQRRGLQRLQRNILGSEVSK